jgi:diguanylate cyclase (GGDEF)-like protein
MEKKKKIAIVGGNKEGLGLLPLLEKDQSIHVEMIVEPNKDALIFKLDELGFRLARKFNIRISSDWNDLLKEEDLDIIIDASSNPSARAFLKKQKLESIEIVSSLSARLLWEDRSKEEGMPTDASQRRHSKLLASLNEIVEAVNLTKDKRQVTSLILKVAIESTGANNGSLMLLDAVENVLKVEVAEGIPSDIIPTIRCPLGEGIAGRVALEGKPLLLSGKADDSTFRILREREDVKSALCVPLTINGSTVGVLNLNNLKSIDGFTKEDLAFITKLAAFDAEILLKSQEYEVLKGNAHTFQIWKEFNQILNAPGPLHERLLKVCRTISNHFRESVCSIYLFDKNSKELTLKASSIKDFTTSNHFRINLKEGIDGWAANEQEVVVLKDYPSLDSRSKKAFMSIPLVSEGEINGIMNIQLISSQGLSEEEESLLRDIGRHLTDGVKSAQKEDSANMRATKIEAINEAGINILSIMDMNRLIELIPPSVAMIMDADGCILRLREKDGGIKIRSTYSMWEDEIQDKIFELDEQISEQVERSREPVHIVDLADQEGFERFGRVIKSVIGIPILENGWVQGVITIYDKIPKGSFHATSFGSEDLEIFKKFAHYVEKAMINVRGNEQSRIFLNYDKLTGLPNENAFKQEIENEINRSSRFKRRFILLTLCWSYHKPRIEQYDVEIRNNMILEIVDVLKENVREYDTLARTGPLKFSILFPESVERIKDLSTRLIRAIRRKKKHPGATLSTVDLEFKFGYAVFPEDGTELETILQRADLLRLGSKI